MYMMIFCSYFNYTRAIWNLSINNNNNNNNPQTFSHRLWNQRKSKNRWVYPWISKEMDLNEEFQVTKVDH